MKIGTQELLIILAIVIIIFGPSQLPKLRKMFGKSIKSMKEGMEGDDETEKAVSDQKPSDDEKT